MFSLSKKNHTPQQNTFSHHTNRKLGMKFSLSIFILSGLIGLSASPAVAGNVKGHLKNLAANDTMHLAFYSNKEVSTGDSDDFGSDRSPYPYELADTYSLDDVFAISANDKMVFAWYNDGRVSAGTSDDLAKKRNASPFKLAPGYELSDVISISSNDKMHFAWYKDGTVSAGSSDNLAKYRSPYNYSVATGHDISDVVEISSNDKMHFAFYKDGTVSAGTSNNLDSIRSPYEFFLAAGFTLAELYMTDVSVSYEDLDLSGETSSDFLLTESFHNDSDATLFFEFTASESFTSSFEWSFNQQLSIGTEFSTEVGVPLVGSGEVTTSVELTVGAEQVSTTTTTTTLSFTKGIEVPPFSSVKAVFGADLVENLEVPFVMDITYEGQMNGKHLTSEEVIEQLKKTGIEGTFNETSPGSIAVTVDGTFRGSYGLQTFFLVENI